MAPRIDNEARPICHILDFFYDDEDSSALTALVNGVRFHVILDAKRLRKAGHEPLLTEYLLLLQNLRSETDSDASPCEPADHQAPPSTKKHTDPEPPSPQSASTNTSDAKDDSDSGVDLSEDRKTCSKERSSEQEEHVQSPELNLQNWILAILEQETAQLAPPQRKSKDVSIEDWYSATTHFFDLDVEGESLCPRRLEESKELMDRMKNLTPQMEMPKSIQNLKVPWHNAEDITVLSEIADPGPVHPGVVRVGKELQFFKPVDPTQPLPAKREIKVLSDIAKLGLADKIRVPQLLGFVAYKHSSTRVMGMLLTHIANPRPLTTLLSSDVPEPQRLRWAEETQEIVQTLHDSGIIWGDAKADNFLVDENDDLWIIDFGGSYTEGWIDPEIAETKQGDDMGVEKTVNALVDPDENTFDPEDDDQDDEDYVPQSDKRKRKSSESSSSGRKKLRSG